MLAAFIITFAILLELDVPTVLLDALVVSRLYGSIDMLSGTYSIAIAIDIDDDQENHHY